ncbi:MAG: hypothetical protein ACRD3Q_05975 [Terriglobales bacterium]
MLQLENLQGRVPFGPATDPAQCAPWPKPVSAFNLSWLKSTFVTDQRDRLARVKDAIGKANAEIEKIRAGGTVPAIVGQRQPNGNILRSGDDLAAERSLRTHAQKQLVSEIIEIRQKLDPVVPPILHE